MLEPERMVVCYAVFDSGNGDLLYLGESIPAHVQRYPLVLEARPLSYFPDPALYRWDSDKRDYVRRENATGPWLEENDDDSLDSA